MTTVKIYFQGENMVKIKSALSFLDFIKELFETSIYISLVEGNDNLAINTAKITHIWEVEDA